MLGHCTRCWATARGAGPLHGALVCWATARCAGVCCIVHPVCAPLQFEPVTGDMEGERKKALEILDKIQSKQPVLDVNKVRTCDAGDWGGRWVSCASWK